MAKIIKEKVSVSIDVGTTKICVMVAHHVNPTCVEILATSRVASDGLQKGVVINVAKTVQSIKAAVQEAQKISGVAITRASIGISGAHIRSLHSHGIVAVKSGQVRSSDITYVLQAAQAVSLPEGYQILHVLPQYFILDGQVLQDPLAMFGIRLEVRAHIILGAVTSVQNLVTCCEVAGVQVDDIILEPLASAHAVLSKDERQLGVALLDIGGGTADLAIYQNSSIVHTMVLPIAGNHFTHDIAIGLRTSIKDAERIKIQEGTVNLYDSDKQIEIELTEGNAQAHISRKMLTVILHARAQEMLHIIGKEITDNHLQPYCTSGLVITGGGSLLHGIDKLAQSMFNMPVRIGKLHASYELPATLGNPMYATGYGLLLYALQAKQQACNGYEDGPFVQRVAARMKSWISDFF